MVLSTEVIRRNKRGTRGDYRRIKSHGFTRYYTFSLAEI